MSFAEVIHEQGRRHARRDRNVLRAEVVDTRPLKVEMISGKQVLDDEDFDLTAWMEIYRDEWGIEVGDTVLLQREDGDYILFDVLNDDDVELAGAKSVKRELKELRDRIKDLEDA